MDAMHPRCLLRSLKTIGNGVKMLCTHRWRLLPVVVAIFLLNLALTALLVKVASPAVNLDSMGLFYEIDDNSTAPAAQVMVKTSAIEDEGTETRSALWKLQLFGELLWRSLMMITVFEFSKIFILEDHNSLRQGGDVNPVTRVQWILGIFHLPLTWRDVKSLAFLVLLGEVVVMFLGITFSLLDEDDELHDHFRKLADLIGFVYLATAVVISSEGIYGFGAVDKAWRLVGGTGRYADFSIFAVSFILTMEALGFAFEKTFAQGQQKEVAAAVIREDTFADIFRFSLIAAFVAVIVQSFVGSVMLAFYKEITVEQHRRKGVVYEIKKIQRLTREFASMHATPETEVFKRELLKHTGIALQQMDDRRIAAAIVKGASTTTSPSPGRREPRCLDGTSGAQLEMERTGQEGVRRGSRARRSNRLYQSNEWDL